MQRGGNKAEVDYIFNIPVELAKALTGFRHDEDIQKATGDSYVVLEAAIGGEKSLIARIVTMFKGSRPSSVLVLLLLAIVLSPVLLVAALLSVPWIMTVRLVGRIVQKRRTKRFLS